LISQCINDGSGSVTIWFVRNINVLHVHPSDDPIFPALDTSQFRTSEGNPLYSNNLERSTVLACADTNEIRHPTTGAIWFPSFQNSSVLNSAEWHPASIMNSAVFIREALLNAERFSNRHTADDAHWEAIKKLTALFSSTIDREQWKTEARKMFTIKLARLQLEIFGIGQGAGHDLPYTKNTLFELGFDGCGKIKYRSQGWQNVNIFGLVSLLLLAFCLWASTVEVGETIGLIWLCQNAIAPAALYLWFFVVDTVPRRLAAYWRRLRWYTWPMVVEGVLRNLQYLVHI
jgi:hypothetical protein